MVFSIGKVFCFDKMYSARIGRTEAGMKEVTLIATAAMGLESIVANEVKQLGYATEVENGKVTFNAALSAIPRCNLWLRTADRLKILVGKFSAASFDELFESVKALPWEHFI